MAIVPISLQGKRIKAGIYILNEMARVSRNVNMGTIPVDYILKRWGSSFCCLFNCSLHELNNLFKMEGVQAVDIMDEVVSVLDFIMDDYLDNANDDYFARC